MDVDETSNETEIIDPALRRPGYVYFKFEVVSDDPEKKAVLYDIMTSYGAVTTWLPRSARQNQIVDNVFGGEVLEIRYLFAKKKGLVK
ncbi:MAG: hypothetical protein NXH95_13570 [Pseudomonadaceae bacterium]|nr:hypothetical protein [Pseudomonadaceae bacterium]